MDTGTKVLGGLGVILVLAAQGCLKPPAGGSGKDAAPGFNRASAFTADDPNRCSEIKADELYHCPSQELPAQAEFLYVKLTGPGRSLYAANLKAGTLNETHVFTEPPGWRLEQNSISPDRKIILVTMVRPDCRTDWPNPEGASCSWGRGTLWTAFLRKDASGRAAYYELSNLAVHYGRNSNIVGWHTWLTPTRALFNAKINPDGVSLMPDPFRGNGFGYSFDIRHDGTRLTSLSASLWGGTLINDSDCFIGRMHASLPPSGYNGQDCSPGQRVVFARRCYDEPIGPRDYSWYNTVNYDGTGGTCRPQETAGQAQLVPVFRNYIVELDRQCNPVSFSRDNPMRTPDYSGRYRHMGTNPEWGDGQPVISPGGDLVAFWSKKSSLASSGTNCSSLESKDGVSLGDGADRVRVCVLGTDMKCALVLDLPEPADPWTPQGGAYFYAKENGNPAVFTSENDGGYLTDLVTRTRTRVLTGAAGYPLIPVQN